MKTTGRPWSVRLQNAAIASGARRHHFGRDAVVPFLCECEDERCDAYVEIQLVEYDALRDRHLHVVAEGHQLAGGSIAHRSTGYLAIAV